MHRAPAVTFSVKRSRWQARCLACLALLALVFLAVFARDQAVLDLRTGGVALASIIATGAAVLAWRQAPQGDLRWDGQAWHWSGFAADPACRLGLLMDFQVLVIVRITAPARGAMLLWLEDAPGVTHWKALRRAIVSSQTAPDHADPLAEMAEGGSA